MSDDRFDSIDEKLDTLATHISSLYESHQRFVLQSDERHTTVMAAIKSSANSFEERLTGRFEAVDARLTTVDAKLAAVDVKLDVFIDAQREVNRGVGERHLDDERRIAALERKRR